MNTKTPEQIMNAAVELLTQQLAVFCPRTPKVSKWQRLKMWLKRDKPKTEMPESFAGTITIRKPTPYQGRKP